MKKYLFLPLFFISSFLYADEGEVSVQLFKHAIHAKEENVVFSPFSLREAMGMCYLGAERRTFEEIRDSLSFPQTKETFLHTFSKPQGFESCYGFTYKEVLLREQYREILTKNYGASFFPYTSPADTTKRINAWVDEKTHHNIPTLLSEQSVAQSNFILLNAIYFKKSWQKTFNKELTKDEPFYLSKGGKKKVPTMHNRDELLYYENQKMQFLSMPFAGDGTNEHYTAYIILPKEGAFSAVKKALSHKRISRWAEKAQGLDVRLWLPKVKIEASTQCTSLLEKMGIHDAFSPDKASFTTMSPHRLCISEVLQKATLTMDEEGAEAAAATAIVFTRCSCVEPPPKPIEMRCDHPYFVLIVENSKKLPIFMAQITDPS